ncbi:helix-turn-helix domain-containing protein [Methylovirgula sp. HY1]|uniref:helix-turn-helix domain-containing protein n=1 Tax=Methylovirgula sp. HY1 TaxID=2822761 RepID=UPI001C5AE892|nr:helix-turn-helix domain-containing protein [Methylovirgula sp. HY1]QXX74928.1 Hydrogenase transcriptional regulatory protein hupR1 [Methylovirgula sp. HY1]
MSFASTVLFVADCHLPCRATAEALIGGFGYRLFAASCQAEAVAFIHDAPVDLVLADVDSHDCDVIDLLASLRFSHPDLPRLLLVGEDAGAGLSEMLARTAAYQYLTKPNKPLKRLVETGRFREDLYFRLRGFELEVPPLRARPADIPVLVEFFVGKHGGLLGNRVRGVSEDVIDIFKAHPFPGNVRELENEVRRMIALAKDGEYLTRRHLSPTLAKLNASARAAASPVHKDEERTLKQIVEGLEAQVVGQVLKKHRWNQSKAARELGLSRVGLANKIRRYALDDGQMVARRV